LNTTENALIALNIFDKKENIVVLEETFDIESPAVEITTTKQTGISTTTTTGAITTTTVVTTTRNSAVKWIKKKQ
jgi:hypothetical protein